MSNSVLHISVYYRPIHAIKGQEHCVLSKQQTFKYLKMLPSQVSIKIIDLKIFSSLLHNRYLSRIECCVIIICFTK